MARYSFQGLVMVEINKTEFKLSNDHLLVIEKNPDYQPSDKQKMLLNKP